MRLTEHRNLALTYLLASPAELPPESSLPLVIFLHGRGRDMRDLAGLAEEMDLERPCRFVFPNAPRPFQVSPGMTFGFSWFDGWPANKASLVSSRDLLLRFLGELVAKYPTPEGEVILSGFSQGGLMSIDVGYRTEVKLAGIVVMSGAIFEEDLPDLQARREQKILIVHGTGDDMIPVLAARKTRRILMDHGIDPEYHEFPMAHHVSPESLETVVEFMKAVLS